MQDAPPARIAGQLLLVSENAAEPDIESERIPAGSPEEFVIANDIEGLSPTTSAPKSTVAGFAKSIGCADLTPVPASPTTSEAWPVIGMVRVPASAPTEVGANCTVTVQLAPAASDAPQLLVPLNPVEATSVPSPILAAELFFRVNI